jgi:hypothetical protein
MSSPLYGVELFSPIMKLGAWPYDALLTSYSSAVKSAMSQAALKYSLQALAESADFQRRLLHVWLEEPAELPERFVQARKYVVANPATVLTKPQADSMAAIYAIFRSFSGPAFAEHWSEDALDSSPHWEAARRAALICLEAFGWPAEQPPLDVSSWRGLLSSLTIGCARHEIGSACHSPKLCALC